VTRYARIVLPHRVPSVRVDEVPTDAVLLDVREPDEWAAGHIAGALHVPMNDVPRRIADHPDTLTANAPVVVVCKMGSRSAKVTAWLRHQGYDALNLDGGMLAWARAGRPMEAADGPPRVG
jgi:rhodanese-related sulfurtransferase